jgi:hypothetical protein
MSAADVTISGILYDKLNRTTQQVVLIGEATLTGLGVGGGPMPGGPPPGLWPPGSGIDMPTHPWVPPSLQPPTQPPTDPTVPKPPPPNGGWGWHPEYGWGYFPMGGGKPQPPGA